MLIVGGIVETVAAVLLLCVVVGFFVDCGVIVFVLTPAVVLAVVFDFVVVAGCFIVVVLLVVCDYILHKIEQNITSNNIKLVYLHLKIQMNLT